MTTNKWLYPPVTLLNPTSTFTQVLASRQMQSKKSKLAVTLGISGQSHPEIVNLHDLSHVLIGGTTGSGKSMLLHTWICSLLMRTTPQEVRLILVDPKRVELLGYDGMPHLLTPVLLEMDKCISALMWMKKEMENRYKQLNEVGVKNIDEYNKLSGFQALPYIVVIIDEFSDLMAYDGKKVDTIMRLLAMMSRATGIHTVISTSRVGKDVYPGEMKAFFPTHIAFNTADKKASNLILDMEGAELLLGSGDMFIQLPGKVKVKRVQGAYISEKEVDKIVTFSKLPRAYAAWL